MKNVVLTIASIILFSAFAFAQDASIGIKTSFHCANGKALIEKEMAKVDGVKTVVADVETKVVTITYNEKVINKDGLVAAIEKIGYKTEFTPEDKPINKACSHGEHGTGHQE